MSTSSRIRLLALAIVALVAVAWPGGAQARTVAMSYGTGEYSGAIVQVVPKPYAGTIAFVVSQGKVTGLADTFGVACQGIGWVRDRDVIPTLAIHVGPSGGFSYVGKIGRRSLRLSGVLIGDKAMGSFFQTFWFGHSFCTMNRPAQYTALG